MKKTLLDLGYEKKELFGNNIYTGGRSCYHKMEDGENVVIVIDEEFKTVHKTRKGKVMPFTFEEQKCIYDLITPFYETLPTWYSFKFPTRGNDFDGYLVWKGGTALGYLFISDSQKNTMELRCYLSSDAHTYLRDKFFNCMGSHQGDDCLTKKRNECAQHLYFNYNFSEALNLLRIAEKLVEYIGNENKVSLYPKEERVRDDDE